MTREIFYPPVGIAHITDKLSDLIRYKIEKQTTIIINTSAQPNSSPHLGTITTIMTSFALAKHIKKEFGINSIVQFDKLENSPCKTYEINGNLYYKDQKHFFDKNNISMEEINMLGFNDILKKVSNWSGIDFVIRSYNDFQNNKYVRRSIIDIVNMQEYYKQLLFPSSMELHIRTICPKCGLGIKKINKLLESHNKNKVEILGYCPIHGEYKTIITEDNHDYIDINTQLRDLTKGVAMINDDKDNNTLTIMMDGNDWSGIWAQRIHTEGMVGLGYYTFPIRFFAPVILDWSGAKFSKSMYLKNDAYRTINKAFINYNNFLVTYGYEGLKTLWNEVENWINDPKKFFRNYSIDYFEELFGDFNGK